MLRLLLIISICFSVTACLFADRADTLQRQAAATPFQIPFTKYQLDNGLTVILHEDHSDPVVAIATALHVGSSREKKGRSGFAHFFEHMAFNDSENVPKGANRTMIAELGGSRNGETDADSTIYYEVVPKDAFQKLLWIDSDRLGYMINTVTESALEREKQVVKNEKRQYFDNQAYGHTAQVIQNNLYPSGHPYHWPVIGQLDELQAATLQDVKSFYSQYYGPANATVVICGDIDIVQTRLLVEQWFGEIRHTQPIEKQQPQPVTLKKNKYLYYLDNFALQPELTMNFPTVEQYHEDYYPLKTLAEIMENDKQAPLYKEIVTAEKLAPQVLVSQQSQELAGSFQIRVRAYADTNLDSVAIAVNKALTNFAHVSIKEADLKKLQIRQETDFYNQHATVLQKAKQLAVFQTFAEDPAFLTEHIARIKRVTVKDVARVYDKYIRNKHFVLTSFVPKTQPELVVSGSQPAEVKEELFVTNSESAFALEENIKFAKTETVYDRSEPPLGKTSKIVAPKIYKSLTDNGLQVWQIEHHELPVVNFSLRMTGGAWLETPQTLGLASMLAAMLNEGSHSKTPRRINDSLATFGARLTFSSDVYGIYVTGNTINRYFKNTLSLASKMLLQPHWDPVAFEKIKSAQLDLIRQQKSKPAALASQAFYHQLYGDKHRAGLPIFGTEETVTEIQLSDLQAFYQKYFSPKNAILHIVGDVTKGESDAAVAELFDHWQGESVVMPDYQLPPLPATPRLYFVDIPGAKQSVIIAGKPALKGDNKDYLAFNVAQTRFGYGSSGKLFQSLRVEKGYTYGAYSVINQTHFIAPFLAYSQVRTNVTLESVKTIQALFSSYLQNYKENDLTTSKNLLLKQNATKFESQEELLAMLEEMSEFNLPADFAERRTKEVTSLTLEEIKRVYQIYANEQQMTYLIAGDASTQLDKLEQLGFGKPILIQTQHNQGHSLSAY